MPTPIITIQKVTNAFAVTIIRIDTDGAIVRSITPKDFDYRINALTNGFSVDIFDDGVIAYSIADIAFIVVGLNLISDTPAQKEIQLQDLKEASGGTVTSNDPALTATAPFVSNSAADILKRIENKVSTEAKQDVQITSLASIDAGIPTALGQTTMAASMPVTIANNQSAIPISGTVSVTSGNSNDFGDDRVADNSAQVNFSVIGTVYAALGLDVNSGTGINLKNLSTFFSTADRAVIQVRLNPTVAGTFTYAAVAGQTTQVAVGVLANTVTGGTIIRSTIVSGKDSLVSEIDLFKLNKITGAADKIVICIIPVVANVSIRTIINFKEQV